MGLSRSIPAHADRAVRDRGAGQTAGVVFIKESAVTRFLIRWFINGIALYVASRLVSGIIVEGGWPVIVGVALVFGLVNALLRPLLKVLTCPLIILTLGLFTLVVNALMLLLTSWIAAQLGLGFRVDGFWPAFLGGLVISIVSFLLSLVLVDKDHRK
jgi:putative membrane protein